MDVFSVPSLLTTDIRLYAQPWQELVYKWATQIIIKIPKQLTGFLNIKG